MSIHEVYVFLGELKWRILEVHVSGTALQHEAEVNVDHVTLPIDHNVAIVTVFDSKKICKQAVARQTAYEVSLCLFEAISEVPFIKISQVA